MSIISNWWTWLISHRLLIFQKAVVPLMLIVAGIAVEDQFKDWWVGPKSYKIYLVGSLTDRETQRIFRGFENRYESLAPRIGNVPVEITIVDDRGSVTGAKSASREISQSDDALLVIGHVLSTDTIAALPNYLESNPAIPVITTRETNPDLKCPQPVAECPVLRMSPTDADQAKTIVDYVIKKNPHARLAIVAGDYNATYTQHLAQILASEVSKKGLQRDLFSSQAVIPPNQFQNRRYDFVLMAGEPDDSLTLVSRIRDEFRNSVNVNKVVQPVVILTDASFDQTLLVGDSSDAMDGVLVSYQLGHYDEDQPYHEYGLDAFDLASDLLSRTNGRILDQNTPWSYKIRRAVNMHRITDARKILLRVIDESLNHHDSFLATSGERYEFDTDGHRMEGRFHIWRVRVLDKPKFVDIDGDMDNRTQIASASDRSVESPTTSHFSADSHPTKQTRETARLDQSSPNLQPSNR